MGKCEESCSQLSQRESDYYQVAREEQISILDAGGLLMTLEGGSGSGRKRFVQAIDAYSDARWLGDSDCEGVECPYAIDLERSVSFLTRVIRKLKRR